MIHFSSISLHVPGTVEDCHEAEIKRYLCALNKVNILQNLKEGTKVLLYLKEKRYKSISLPKRKKKYLFI